jgi:hypothetical protein
MTERERLRAAIEDLSDDEVHGALRFVESLGSSTPPEDQPVAEEDAKHGRIISHEGMRRRVFGRE